MNAGQSKNPVLLSIGLMYVYRNCSFAQVMTRLACYTY
jgi:hypothetical protein